MQKIKICNSGVYQIRNLLNGKIYVGSTYNLTKREYKHFYDLDNNIHSNKHLQYAFNKYKEESFVFEVLEYIGKVKNADKFRECLIDREQYWIDILDVCNLDKGYNINKNAYSCLGVKRSEETKQKMSEIKKGKHIGENNPMYGKKHTEKTKYLITVARKNQTNTPFYGKHHTEEAKEKISIAKIGITKGENNPNAKLNIEQVIEIKKLLKEGILLQKEIANIYKVTKENISCIKTGKLWSHIKIEDYPCENVV